MLIRFNVKNFLSFFEKKDGISEEFSMIAGKVRSKNEHIYDDGKLKLLKLATIYGANASGKSNFVRAMDFMRNVVLSGLPEGHTNKYCKTNEKNVKKPSYFELEMKIDEKYYSYGFEVILSKSEFISEWLVELTSDNKEKCVFTRDIKNGIYEFGPDLKKDKKTMDKLDVYAEDVRDDSGVLFLKLMNQNKKNIYNDYEKLKPLRDVYKWIKSDLDINYPDRPISDYSYMAEAEDVEEVCRIISAFGTGITDYSMVDVPVDSVLKELPEKIKKDLIANVEKNMVESKKNKDKKDTINAINFIMRSNRDFFILYLNDDEKMSCKTIKFSHETDNVFFDLSEESDGTIRILDLLEVLISGEGKTYVIDELDRCLHPSLTYKFIYTYLELAAKKNIQLIVTTHESRLLDFDLLRRDEIWFVNKRKTGESDVYSLEEYNERFDKKIDKAYLEGRYGGVPIFNTLFPLEKKCSL